MARKSRNQMEGRSPITRGRRLHDLEDSETEEELKRFLEHGADFEAREAEEAADRADDPGHRPYHVEQEESLGSLGQFWLADK